MSATEEQWKYEGDERVWVGKYLNSQNTLHWHSDCELIYVERGELDVVADGACYRLKKSDAMFLASETLHRINAVAPDALLQTIIFDNRIISDYANALALSSPLLENDHGVPKLYSRLLYELAEKAPMYVYETAAEVNRLMIDVYKSERTEPKKPKSTTDVKLKALLADIRNRYDIYTLDDAAQFMGMNASYLSRFFTERTGMHFMRYVNSVRIEKAIEMLLIGDKSVTEIADRCGFGTIRNFNRIFKILTGYSPSGLPNGYTFDIAGTKRDGTTGNPTLNGCVLVESSTK